MPVGFTPMFLSWFLMTVVNDVVPSGNLHVWDLSDWYWFLILLWRTYWSSNLTGCLHCSKQAIGWNISLHLFPNSRRPSEEVRSWFNLDPSPPVCIHQCYLPVGWDWGTHLLVVFSIKTSCSLFILGEPCALRHIL